MPIRGCECSYRRWCSVPSSHICHLPRGSWTRRRRGLCTQAHKLLSVMVLQRILWLAVDQNLRVLGFNVAQPALPVAIRAWASRRLLCHMKCKLCKGGAFSFFNRFFCFPVAFAALLGGAIGFQLPSSIHVLKS